MPDGIGCIPPVVSPTLGGSKFVYTSGGSCGRACIIPPKVDRHLPAVLEVAYLRSSVLAGRCLPAVRSSTCGAFGMFTSGGAEIFMPDGMGVYLWWFRLHSAGVRLSIPPVAPADVPAIFHPRVGDIYLRWGRDVYPRCFWCLPPVVSPTLGESKFKYTSGGSCGRACNVPPIDWDIYLRCKNI